MSMTISKCGHDRGLASEKLIIWIEICCQDCLNESEVCKWCVRDEMTRYYYRKILEIMGKFVEVKVEKILVKNC